MTANLYEMQQKDRTLDWLYLLPIAEIAVHAWITNQIQGHYYQHKKQYDPFADYDKFKEYFTCNK